MVMKLIPLGPHQMYVSGLSAGLAKVYKDSPGIVNQHAVQAIFEPINDAAVVMVYWSFGGFNLTSRDSIKILDTEKQELLPAWE